jgi:hypothetical protein
MSQLGQKAKYSLRADVFRFAPESGLKSDIAPCPKSAKPGSARCTIMITLRYRGTRAGCPAKSRPRITCDMLRKMFRIFADAPQK